MWLAMGLFIWWILYIINWLLGDLIGLMFDGLDFGGIIMCIIVGIVVLLFRIFK